MSGGTVLPVAPDGLLHHPDVHPLAADRDPVLAVLLHLRRGLSRPRRPRHHHRPHHDHPVLGRPPVSAQGTTNKPRTAKVGAISKTQNLKGEPFGICETPAGCKKFKKKLKGGPFGDMKKFPKKFLNEIFEQFHSPEKCKRGNPLRFFDIHCVAKYRNK